MGDPLTLSEVAALVGGTVEGNGDRVVRTVRSLDAAGADPIIHHEGGRSHGQVCVWLGLSLQN